MNKDVLFELAGTGTRVVTNNSWSVIHILFVSMYKAEVRGGSSLDLLRGQHSGVLTEQVPLWQAHMC